MQHISASSLQDLRSVVAPLVPAVVDAVYEKLLSFDITANSFVPGQTGYTGVALGNMEELTNQIPSKFLCVIFGVDGLRKGEEMGVSG